MATAIKDSLTDHSPLDGTNDAINGAEVDANPNVISQILDGTTTTDLATDSTVDFRFTSSRAGLRLIDTDNAGSAIHYGLDIEWNPGDDGQMTDGGSGVGMRFIMPDAADTQTAYARMYVLMRDDTAASDDAEFVFEAAVGGTLTTELLHMSQTNGIVFNDDSGDIDFRIEGANTANGFLLDAGQDAISLGGANVDGAAFTLNNLQSRTAITSVGSQLHIPAQTTNFDNSSGTIAIGAAMFIGIPTWTNASATLTMTHAASLYIQGVPVDSTNVTATNTPYALWVDAGATQLDGAVTVGGNLSVGGDFDVTGSFDMSDANITNVGSIALDTITNDGTDITLDSSGDIVLDADGADIFFKDAGTTFGSATNTSGNLIIKSGTTTALTFSGANVTGAGTYTGGGTMTTGGNIVIPDAGNIGSASDTDAIAISSGGVVTMNQIPVFSAGINVSGGTIAGTLATAAQGSVTSLGTLTALQVDYINANASTLTVTDSSDTGDKLEIAVGTHGATTIITTDDDAAAANIQITADGTAELAGTTVTLDSAGDIELEATDDINVPTDVGMTFGDDGEKIEGDGTNLTVASSGLLTLTATGNTVVTNNALVSGTLAVTGTSQFTGNVGIGVSPATTLHLSASVPKLRITDTGASGYMDMRGANSEFVFDLDPGAAQSTSRMAFAVDGATVIKIEAGILDMVATGNRIDFNTANTTSMRAANTGTLDFEILTVDVVQMSAVGLLVANGYGMVIGHTAQVSSGGQTPELQVLGTSDADSIMTVQRFSADSSGPALHIGKSRGSSIGAYNTVETGDVLGTIFWHAADGTDMAQAAVRIIGAVEGTIAGNRTPSNLQFYTSTNAQPSVLTRAMTIDSSQRVGIGTASPSHLFTVEAAAGAEVMVRGVNTATAIYLEREDTSVAINNEIGRLSWRGGESGSEDNVAQIVVDADAAWTASSSASRMEFYTTAAGATNGTERMRITSAGNVNINDTTTNANMTVGMTINQGANDNEAFALKSSEVAHLITNYAETDTYFHIKKWESAGGAHLEGFSAVDDSGGSNVSTIAMRIVGYAGVTDTTKSTSGTAPIQLVSGLKSGSAAGDVASNGNLLVVAGYAADTQFIVDLEGDYHYNGSGSAFDDYADAELVRAFDLERNSEKTIRNQWDEQVRYNKKDLEDAGILGRVSPEEKEKGHRGLVNGAQLQRLHNGAIWQLHCHQQSLKEVVDYQQEEIESLKKELRLLKG